MKRILPVIIALALLITTFLCLPKSTNEKETFETLDSLNGHKVGIQTGTGYEQYLSERVPNAEPVFFEDFASIYPALQQGKIDVMLTESVSFGVEKAEIPSFVAIEEPMDTMYMRCAVGKDSKAILLENQINEFIAKLSASGELEALEKYWVSEYDRPNAKVDKSGITGENGKIRFGGEASFEPACFAGEGGELQGFSIDFIYKFCREYGYEPDIYCYEYTAMNDALAGNKLDIAVGVLEDEERAEEMNFTEPFMYYSIIAVYDSGVVDGGNFFAGLAESFNKTFIKASRWQMFLSGVGITLLITISSAVFGTILGLLLYLWVYHGKKLEDKFTSLICWLMGSTPTVVLLMIFYYIIFGKYAISNTVVAIIAFTLIFACVFYELICSGVKAVGNGQFEAGRAQGFSKNQTFFRIIFPQAAEHFMPQYQSSIISLIQGTSVVGYIAVMDLTKQSDLVRGRTYEAFFPLLATACIYFLIIWLLTTIVKFVAKKIDKKNRSKEKILKGIKID